MRWEQLTLPASIFLFFLSLIHAASPHCFPKEKTLHLSCLSTQHTLSNHTSQELLLQSLSLFLAVPLACGMLIL